MPNITRYITAGDAVRSVMTNIGLTAPATVSDNTDKTALQMFSLATDVGQRLAGPPNKWQFMTSTFEITTVPGQSIYAVPADVDNFYSDASWNRTTRLPAIGGLTEQEWQQLKARLLAGTTFTMLFRYDNGNFEFYETPQTVQTIVIPYQSRAWARLDGDNTPVDNLQNDSDIILYDPQLFKAALKLAWYEAKQFDTTTVMKDYMMCYAAAKSKDVVGRSLSLSSASEFPYLGQINIPDTRYGF